MKSKRVYAMEEENPRTLEAHSHSQPEGTSKTSGSAFSNQEGFALVVEELIFFVNMFRAPVPFFVYNLYALFQFMIVVMIFHRTHTVFCRFFLNQYALTHCSAHRVSAIWLRTTDSISV